MSEKLEKFISELYERNPHVKLLGIHLERGDETSCVFSMDLKRELHGNAHEQTHGGALMSLADTAMGAGCAFFNKKVVTLTMTTTFFAPARIGSKVFAETTILHNGRRTVGLEATIIDNEDRLIGKASGTFFVLGQWVEEEQS